MNNLLLISFLAAGSFILTYLIIRIALKNNLVSIPNERSLHVSPTPVGGGLAIVLSWYTGITVLYLNGSVDKDLYFALMSGVILTIISFIDDLVTIKPSVRLLFHFVIASIAFYLLGGLRPFIIPGIDFDYRFISYPLAIIGIVWFINLFNFMDGVDGFASVEAIIICFVMFYLSGNIINLILIACVIGFLYWNWPKAKIFMGDVGSTQLGFILVILGIYFHNTLKFSILNWIMLASPFWFDATLTLYRRWRNGEELKQAHRKHAYQRIVQYGFSHLQANISLVLINVILIIIIWLYREFKILQVPSFILTLIFYYLITLQVDKRVPFRNDGRKNPGKNA